MKERTLEYIQIVKELINEIEKELHQGTVTNEQKQFYTIQEFATRTGFYTLQLYGNKSVLEFFQHGESGRNISYLCKQG